MQIPKALKQKVWGSFPVFLLICRFFFFMTFECLRAALACKAAQLGSIWLQSGTCSRTCKPLVWQ